MSRHAPIHRFHRLLRTSLVVALALFFAQSTAQAAGPRAMIVYGESLEIPIRIDLWDAGFGVLAGPEYQGSEADFTTRPYLKLGFFWGPTWSDYLDSGGSIEDLQPEQANWHGRLYPAGGGREAVIYATGYGYRLLESDVIKQLEERGVPVRIEIEPADARGDISAAAWWFIGVTAILLAGSVIVAYRRVPARRLRLDATPRGR